MHDPLKTRQVFALRSCITAQELVLLKAIFFQAEELLLLRYSCDAKRGTVQFQNQTSV